MLQIAAIRENKEAFAQALTKRNIDAMPMLEQAIEVDERRRSLQAQLDETLSQSNKLSKQIGELFKSGKAQEANELKAQTGELKESSKNLAEQLQTAQNDLQELLYNIPNVPQESVPAGSTDEDNEVVEEHGVVPVLDEQAQPHWELVKKYDIIDFELGNKITGAGFPVYKNKGARLQRALINYFLDKNTAAGYQEMQVPHLVNEASGYGTGQLPDKEGQMYHVGNDDLYLIPTAEVPITNLYRGDLLEEKDLPIAMTGYTPCFRREAGSYGAHVRGLNRLHQFDKVEILRIEHPDKSDQALDDMVSHVKNILDELKLPYRILRLCGGDLGFTSTLTYDFEVYSTAQEKWLEVSSVSNFKTFQANRLKLRFRAGEKQTELLHTLNGSALALPRIMAGILENYQTADGIKIPEVLVPYCGFDMIQ
ncbi:seryl-tRNA synthetase [Nonlabens tegetincola]|uniref:Serine--tRNA ligase n=1 Tax=Nonlabens tegetincola TaxID=323273 RepID=A0A090Q1F1_9FLAO|nr:serine--tRNA ligase [Nonlabens tegetincola]ARN70178.1 serine--tRNA ligase [Nonlabens tegetincola]MEE2801267.1 serine--tRNA ligase [Bacteroidota bacterium]GAK95533.1 seryl-tRNA synthetase [Nonlabens tegetincola]